MSFLEKQNKRNNKIEKAVLSSICSKQRLPNIRKRMMTRQIKFLEHKKIKKNQKKGFFLRMQQTNDSREAITNRLNEVLRKPHLLCAECSAKNPFWAIPNLGLIICIECAGQYRRKVGVHIAMVRSIKLDVWKRNDVEKLFVWSAAHSKAFRKLFEMSELSITKRANHPNVTREREMVDWLR